MPELPEVEHLRRTLEPLLIGAEVVRVQVRRRDVLRRAAVNGRPRGSARVSGRELLAGATISKLDRRGKQLAIVSDAGPVLCVHLGMSGQLRFVPGRQRLDRSDHVHCIWHLRVNGREGRLIFRDPRRFGGVWACSSLELLKDGRWACLGPDALTITAAALARQLASTRRPIKAALLDQRILAGVGNIYADEALFAARVHPLSFARAVPRPAVTTLAAAIRATLRQAVKAGGSTLRDYTDGNGQAGWFAVQHRVYGRGGRPCVRCRRPLEQALIAQRTTVLCRTCQTLYPQPNGRGS